MDGRSQRADAQLYSTNLDYTLKELQKKVREHETELEKIRSTQRHDTLPASVAEQSRLIQSALEDVTNSEPFLPFPSSLLPALLALRKTHQTIEESKVYLASQNSSHEQDKRQLEFDQVRLKDQHLLADALNARIISLREELNAKADITPEDGARERHDELKRRKKTYDKETSKLMKALISFIKTNLAPMLAAEELGGPVVGDIMDIDSEDLAAGFNAQGTLKKAKEGANLQDKRQRRIDEIWGAAEDQGRQDNEVTAAGTEMIQLTEELLNRLAEANGDNSASYVQLPRESAAARFLVRSKVAQFHPKDATRLRLIDFGRELEA
ncbi:Fc.00g063660.m01.CDS01 [Cosmosporella sp. VM-42]